MSQSKHASRLYWPLQIGGWTAYGMVGFVINLSFDTGLPAAKVAALAFCGSATLLLLTHLFRNYARRHHWEGLSFGPLILRLLLGTFLLAVVSQAFLSLLMFWPIDVINAERPYSFRILLIYIFQTQVLLLLWSFIYFSFHAIRNYKREEIEKWRLQAAAADAELMALKSQINPHFIFNCLNNIRALVLEDAERAREAITRLSDLLRYSLQYAQAESVTLEQEIAIVRDYLALEGIHMESRLQYRLEVDPRALECRIPPMGVQLLVENAIKHGLARIPSGGEIRIHASVDDDELHINVSNTGRLARSVQPDSNVGLPNLRERLALLHGPKARFTLSSPKPNQVLASLAIPLPRVAPAARSDAAPPIASS